MKVLVWLIVIVSAAVGLTLAASHNEGVVLLLLPPYEIKVSLNLFLIALFFAFVALYITTRLVHAMLSLPEGVKAMRREKQKAKGRRLLDEALVSFFAGRFAAAEKAAREAAGLGESPQGGKLLAAWSAHELRDFDRCQVYLREAEEGTEDRAPVLVAEAELALANRDARAAQAALAGLKTNNTHILSLKLKAARLAGDWAGAISAVNQLEKRERLEPLQAEQLRLSFYQELFRPLAGDADAVYDLWQGLPSGDRLQAKIVRTAAFALIDAGDGRRAGAVVVAGLEKEWDDDLAQLYGRAVGDDPLPQIEVAEKWLKDHPRDAGLLDALGELCIRAELWGKAQSYLEASASVADMPKTHVKLARLYERIGERDQACEQYRLALAAQAAEE